MKFPSWHWINRRSALGLLIAGGGLALLGDLWSSVWRVRGYQKIARGYGTDPDLLRPRVPWAMTLTERQKAIATRLADLILPAANGAPAPSAIGIARYVDEWVSSPYPEQSADAAAIPAGLTRLDATATRNWGRGYLEIDDAQRADLLVQIAADKSGDRDFFARFRRLVVNAYYTSKPGLDDIGYRGNVALDAYPAMTADETAILDEELRKLGL